MHFELKLKAGRNSYSEDFKEQVKYESDSESPSLGEMERAFRFLKSQAFDKGMLEIDPEKAHQILAKMAKAEGHKEGKEEGEKNLQASYRLQSQITKLEEEKAKMECKIDGLVATLHDQIKERGE